MDLATLESQGAVIRKLDYGVLNVDATVARTQGDFYVNTTDRNDGFERIPRDMYAELIACIPSVEVQA